MDALASTSILGRVRPPSGPTRAMPELEGRRDDERFWGRYLSVGFAELGGQSLGCLLYFLLSPHGPHRAVLELMAVVTMCGAGAALPWSGYFGRERWREHLSLAVAVGAGITLTISLWLDGGLDSPLLFLLALPVVAVAIVLPLAAVTWCAAMVVAEFVLVASTDQELTSSTSVLVLAGSFLAGMLALSWGWAFARSRYDADRRTQLDEAVLHAMTDSLTGCLNNGAFFRRLGVEIDRALRHGTSLGLLVGDVDLFKSYNDRYGHLAGDGALVVVGSTMMASARSSDVVGRIGGDEFALILPETILTEVESMAERLIDSLTYPEGTDLTVSVGYATLDRSEPVTKRLFRDADAALYLAKARGRARAEGPEPAPEGGLVSGDDDLDSLAWGAADTRRFREQLREAQTEALEALSILDAVESSTSLGLAFIDRDFRIARINAVMAAVNGGTIAEQLGRTVAETVPEFWPVLEPAYRQVLETGRALLNREVTGEVAGEPGVRRVWLTNFYPVTAKGVRTGLCVVALDITARKEMEDAQASLTQSLVSALAAAVEMRDPYTDGHQRRVAQLSVAIAEVLELGPDDIASINLGARVHDLGKLATPSEILGRPGRLTEAEMAVVRQHAQIGSNLLEQTGIPSEVRDLVLQHHERLDGSGYPNALRGDQILIGARIIAVADVVEAMSSHRPYRAAVGTASALSEILSGAGKLYDASVVAACTLVIGDRDILGDGDVTFDPAAGLP